MGRACHQNQLLRVYLAERMTASFRIADILAEFSRRNQPNDSFRKRGYAAQVEPD